MKEKSNIDFDLGSEDEVTALARFIREMNENCIIYDLEKDGLSVTVKIGTGF